MCASRVVLGAIAVSALASCAQTQPAAIDPLSWATPSDRAWYTEWTRVRTDDTPAGRHLLLRLSMDWAADPAMATRLAEALPAAEVGTLFERTVAALLKADPADAGTWYAKGWWDLTVRHDATGAEQAGCYAAGLAPGVGSHQEICGDAQITKGDAASGSGHLGAAFKLAASRVDQCRLIWKIQAAALNPDAALEGASPQVITYCRQIHQDQTARQQFEGQRRMQRGNCVATCQAGNSACMSGQWEWGARDSRCASQLTMCLQTCDASYGSAQRGGTASLRRLAAFHAPNGNVWTARVPVAY